MTEVIDNMTVYVCRMPLETTQEILDSFHNEFVCYIHTLRSKLGLYNKNLEQLR